MLAPAQHHIVNKAKGMFHCTFVIEVRPEQSTEYCIVFGTCNITAAQYEVYTHMHCSAYPSNYSGTPLRGHPSSLYNGTY